MSEIKVNHRYTEVIFDDSWKQSYGKDYWEYRKLWEDAPKKQLQTRFPMHLDVDITNYCNLECPMCPRTLRIKAGEKIKPYWVDFKLFKEVVDQGKNNGLFALNLNAAGEPLYHKKIAEMIKYAKDSGVLDVMMHTNATLLNGTISEKLIDAGLDKLIVSFDSPINTHYEKIRIGASFETVVANVKRFVKIKKQKGKKLPQVRINMVVMKENEHEQQMMVDFWKDDVNSIGFLGCINELSIDDIERSVQGDKYDTGFICEKLWQRLSIMHTGDIRICHMDDYNKVIIGNVYSETIEDVWNGDKMNHYRNLHLQKRLTEIPCCKICGLPASQD